MSALSVRFRVVKSDKRSRQTLLEGISPDSGNFSVQALDVILNAGQSKTLTVTNKLYLSIDGTVSLTISDGEDALPARDASGFVALVGPLTVVLLNPETDATNFVRFQAVLA